MNNELKTELNQVLKAQVSSSIRATFNELLAKFGDQMKGVANSRQYSVWRETVRPCCDRSSNRMDATFSLNDSSVDSFSTTLAGEMADELLNKINQKIGSIEGGKAVRVSGANFIIVGSKNGNSVRIEQNQIINCSVKGKLFNQYPSRIYVDGKFVSAAKFGAM